MSRPKRKASGGTTSDGTQSLPETNSQKEAPGGCGLKNSQHGNVFQLKLQMFFLLRGIENRYHFRMATEMRGEGGKFDDLVFKYRKIGFQYRTVWGPKRFEWVCAPWKRIQSKANGSRKKTRAHLKRLGHLQAKNLRISWHWQYRYLQAKHRQDESKHKITATQLLNENDGNFSLAKYFRSFNQDIIPGIKEKRKKGEIPVVKDCIMCTNVTFEEKGKLKKKGIVLRPLGKLDNILNFEKFSKIIKTKTPTCYKLKLTAKLQEKMESWSKIHLLAKKLVYYAKTLLGYALDNKKSSKQVNVLKSYHVTLVKEKIIDNKQGKLRADFLQGQNLTKNAQEFRQILVNETFIHYCNKLSVVKKKRKFDDKKQQKDKKSIEDLGKNLESRNVELPEYAKSSIPISFDDLFADYGNALKLETVIDSNPPRNTKLFTETFIRGAKNLSDKAQKLRDILSKLVFLRCWENLTFPVNFPRRKENSGKEPLNDFVKDIKKFLDKLVFAVDMPNEVELGKILTKMVGKYYNVYESDFQSSYILGKMLDWFKEKDSKWYSSAKGEKLLKEGEQKMYSIRATSRSLDYQEELEILSFNDGDVQTMAEKLEQLLLRCSKPVKFKVMHITTPSPKLTSVKVIAALNKIDSKAMPNMNFEKKDSYLVTSSSRLKKGREKEWIRNVFTKKGNPQQLLIVVCDDGGPGIPIVGDSDDEKVALFDQYNLKSLRKKRVLVIGKDDDKANRITLEDTIAYEQLSQDSIHTLLPKTVSFQRNKSTENVSEVDLMTVEKLIGPKEQCGKVLDASSIEELMSQGEQTNIEIPSYSATSFERSLYIKRQMQFWGDFDDAFWEKVAESINKNKEKKEKKTTVNELRIQCKINSNTGSIEWSKDIDENLKRKIWSKILERTRNSSQKKISEDDLLIDENWWKRAVIISGVAGTGKSTVLSHFYEEIKKKDPSTWVIRINLTDHQTALKEFEKLSNIFEFLVQHIKVVGDSQFARSLLKHRLESGDRIVLMLDGYDEIDGNCQKNTIQLVKCIVADKTRSIGLYLTTRSHMVDELQLELGQLAYSLENFDKKDQINCLTSFWKANSDESKSGDEEKEESDREQKAGELVDKVTKSLNDKERSFIGVPLQCRIVAECFPWQRSSSASDEGDDEKWRNFSLVKLYRLLVKKKHDIYLEEKAKPQKAESNYVNSDVDDAKVLLDEYLIQLAIKTIVSNPEDAKALLEQKKFHSEADREKEKSKRGDKGIRYGLLDVRREGGDDTTNQQKKKVVFLHRTYAEYFVADYLYKGFHLDDNQHNKLLDNEPVRHFIIDKMFSAVWRNDEYNGVRIFLDSMLGELIDTKEWWDIIEKRTLLPERLKQFTREVIPLPGSSALHTSAERRREKTFLFLCDCLDATCDRPQVQTAMNEIFGLRGNLEFFSKPNEYGNASAKVFQRYLSYFDQEEEIKKLMAQICLPDIRYDPQYKSYWDGEEQIEIVKSLLEFYEKNRLSFNQINTKKDSRLHILPLLVWNENYHHDDLLKTYLKLLSETDKYSKDDVAFAKAITQSNRYFYDDADDDTELWIDGRIDKTLIVLRDLNRLDVVIKLWPHVLVHEPEACRRHYIIHQQTGTVVQIINEGAADAVADWLKGLLVPDHFQMTELHREALWNHEENVEEILDKVKEILMSSEGETLVNINRSLAKQVVDLLSGIKEENDLSNEIKEEEEEKEEEEAMKGFTPLHVAIVCRYEEICDVMLSFLKRVDQDKLKKKLIKKDGMIYLALWRCLKLRGDGKKKEVEWILKFIKRQLGQGCLLDFLKSIFAQLQQSRHRFNNSLDTYFPVIRDIVVSMDPVGPLNLYDYRINEDYYKDLNDLVFHNKEHTRNIVEPNSLRSGERIIDSATLRGMLTAKGVADWTRQYLDSVTRSKAYNNYSHLLGFILSSRFLGILTRDELQQQLIEPITEKRQIEGKTTNYWLQDFLSDGNEFLECIFWYRYFNICFSTNKNVDVKWFSQLVWTAVDGDHFKCCKDNDRIIVNLIQLMNPREIFPPDDLDEDEADERDALREFKNDFIRLSKERAQQMIQDVFFSSSSNLESNDITYFKLLKYHLLDLFHFYLDFGSDGQLKKFVDFVTADRHWKKEERQCSFWRGFWTKWWPRRSFKERTIELFQKLLSEKVEIYGTDVVKTLLLHNVDGIPFVRRILSMKEDFNYDILSHLPEETRVVVDEHLRENMPKLIDNFFLHPETYFDEDLDDGVDNLNSLRVFLVYANDNQRENFIKNITKSGTENSIWVRVQGVIRKSDCDDCEAMGRFMRCVKEKLDQEAVRKLAMHHYEDHGPYIGYLLRKGEERAVKAMIGCLDEKSQQEIILKFQEK